MRVIELLIPAWTAAIPKEWTDFAVQFAPADTTFMNMAGCHLMALKGSLLQGSGLEVESLFDGMIKAGYAQEVEDSTVESEKAKIAELQAELATETAKLNAAEGKK